MFAKDYAVEDSVVTTPTPIVAFKIVINADATRTSFVTPGLSNPDNPYKSSSDTIYGDNLHPPAFIPEMNGNFLLFFIGLILAILHG